MPNRTHHKKSKVIAVTGHQVQRSFLLFSMLVGLCLHTYPSTKLCLCSDDNGKTSVDACR